MVASGVILELPELGPLPAFEHRLVDLGGLLRHLNYTHNLELLPSIFFGPVGRDCLDAVHVGLGFVARGKVGDAPRYADVGERIPRSCLITIVASGMLVVYASAVTCGDVSAVEDGAGCGGPVSRGR